ncbi:uncharacterized protein [Pyxicephalus adspersus]|nr:TPA: hypothetical protein GDO54_008393 [Pyxicephalus adspersus]
MSDQPSGIFEHEIFMEDWLWYYITEFHRADIDNWCAKTIVTEEKYRKRIVLKIKSSNINRLRCATENISLLYNEKLNIITKAFFRYSILGAEGPNDKEIEDWCNVFHSCSDELCIRLEEDSLLVVYPKVIEKKLLEEYDCFLAEKNPNPANFSLMKYAHSPSVTVNVAQKNKAEQSNQSVPENEDVEGSGDFSFESYINECIQQPETNNKQKTSLVKGDTLIEAEATPSLVSSLHHNPEPLLQQEADDSLKDSDTLKSKSYDSDYDYEQNIDYFGNLSEEIEQESEPDQTVCDQCRSACCVCGNSSALNVTVMYESLNRSLPGYEQDTCIMIKYEVSDGVQRAEDPQPGKPYRGNTFEAYLPKNTEGRELLALYEKALNQNLTFKIKSTEEGEVVTWHLIPHKTCPDEGESKNGYPDSEYIKNTLALIKTLGIK